jgi:hypothetical protein
MPLALTYVQLAVHVRESNLTAGLVTISDGVQYAWAACVLCKR